MMIRSPGLAGGSKGRGGEGRGVSENRARGRTTQLLPGTLYQLNTPGL